MPGSPAADPREPDDDVGRPSGLDLEEVPVIHDTSQDVVHVVRLLGLVGHDGIEVRVHAVRRIDGRGQRDVRKVVLRQMGEKPTDVLHRLRLVAGREMGHPGATRVDPRSAKGVSVDLLVRHGLHHVGAGDEHVARSLHHHGEVGHGRGVDGATGAGAKDHGDLWHHTRCEHVAQEDLGVATERRHALLDACAAGVVEADDRCADLHGQVHDLADLLRVGLRERTAEDREVLAEDEDKAPCDGAVAGHHSVTEEVLPVHPELRRPVGHKGIQLDEGARIEQQVEPFPRRELAPRMLALDADRSPTL